MTFKEAQDFILSEGRESQDYMRLKVRRYLNRVMHEILSKKYWTFMFKEAVVVLAANKESYTWNLAPFPTDMEFIQALHWIDTDGQIELVQPWEFDQRYPDPTDQTGRPTAMTVKDDTIYFNSKYDASENIRIVYYKKQDSFTEADATDDASEPPWVDFEHLNNAWIWGGLYWMTEFKDDDRADKFLRNYELWAKRGKARDSKMAEERITIPRHVFKTTRLGVPIYPAEIRYIF